MSTPETRERLEHAWVAGYAQIVDGAAHCDMCGKPADVLLHAEPDYRKTPMCWEDARPFLANALDFGDRRFA